MSRHSYVYYALASHEACAPALAWVEAQPDQSPEALWAACPNGSWMLWALEAAGVDTSELGYVCAERARQSALRALPLSPERDALAACAPITDRATAEASAASWASWASWASRAAEAAATAATAAAASAAWAAGAAGAAASAAELSAIANLVRERWPAPPDLRGAE